MPSDRDLGVLDAQQWQRLNELVSRFEQACAAADNVELDPFLPDAADPLRPYVLEELIKSDLDQRWRKGIPAHLESYVQKYPELGSLSALAPQLIFEEYWVRKRHGDRPDLESYRERFPAQFDKLKLMVQETGRPSLTGDEEERALGLAARLKEGAQLPVGDGYQLVRRLGSGNFGQVWEALTPGGKPVAVKVLNWPMNHPAAQREHQSLELIKKLNHPYLLDVIAFYTQQEALVIVTRLCDGNLKDRLKDCKRQGQRGLPADELLRYLAETAEVLDYLNTQNIQHRDIKPENLLLSQGHVAVGDLGLARLVESQQVQASVLGTPPYMAPEVWLGKIHANTDQYSLAITYLELRRGRCPFNTANINGLTADDLKDSLELEPLREAEKAVLLRAGSVNPDQRFRSCTEFVEALQRTVTGTLEAPAYKKIKRIGKGAFGEVWRGEAPGGIACAIKIIPRGGGDKSQSEADALELIKQLTHPYLVKTYACWIEEGELHIAMELADRSLADRINECRKEGLAGIPRDELLAYIRQAAEGLDYLHSRRVLHRDIKPENILLQGNFAKVADFGVARLIGDQHLFTATTSGTMAYMPPEAWHGKYSVTSDQYSLAVTYGEMRLGHRLFTGDSPAETMEAHLHRQPPLAKLPEAEQRVLLKALAKSPDERYPTCKAFVEALEKAATATSGATSLPAAGSEINRTIVPGSNFSAGPESRTEHEVAPIGGAKPGWRSAAAPTPKTDPEVEIPAAKQGWKSAGVPTPTEVDISSRAAPARQPVRPIDKKNRLALVLLPLLALAVVAVLAAVIIYWPKEDGVPATVQVAFTSDPTGATIFVDGQQQDNVTSTNVALKPGKYLVRMQKHKFKPTEKAIDIKAGETAPKIHFDLEPEPSPPPPPPKEYNLTVHSKPDKATVYWEGKKNPAKTDDKIMLNFLQLAGTYDLKLVLDDEHYVFQTKVKIPDTDSVFHEFEPITIAVKSTPSGAKVLIDGKTPKEIKEGVYKIAAGQHTIEASLDGYHNASKVVQISAEEPHPPLEFPLMELPRHQYALLVGVNYPGPDLPWFLHAEPDVEELGRTLIAGGYAKDKINIMTKTRAAGGKSALPNQKNILTALSNLANKCKKKDTLIVALAGHQIQFNDGPKGNFYCPAESQLILDNTLVSMDEVYDILTKCPAEIKVVLLDGWQHSWKEKGVKIPGNIERKRGPEKYPEGVSVLYACGEGASSYDHRMVRHGVFFYFVNRGLQGEADGVGGPKDGVVSLKELDDYLTKQVPSYVAQTYKKPQQKEQEPKSALASNAGGHKLLELSKGLKLFNEGYNLLEKKEYDSAINAFNVAEKEAKEFAEIYLRRGHAWFLKDQGNSDKLIADCKLALQYDPANATAHGFIAEGLRKQNNMAEAIDYHDKAVQADPEYVLGLYMRAVTYTLWAADKAEKLSDAIKDLENANLFNPHVKEVRFWLGQIHAANEEFSKAAAELKIAVDLDPDWKEAREELDKVKKMIKQNN